MPLPPPVTTAISFSSRKFGIGGSNCLFPLAQDRSFLRAVKVARRPCRGRSLQRSHRRSSSFLGSVKSSSIDWRAKAWQTRFTSDGHYHFSELRSGFEIAMGGNDLIERKGSCNDRP